MGIWSKETVNIEHGLPIGKLAEREVAKSPFLSTVKRTRSITGGAPQVLLVIGGVALSMLFATGITECNLRSAEKDVAAAKAIAVRLATPTPQLTSR
ncbi:hypothetical protein HYW41_03085 [Candidatus Daviesbacteria bacterium]|nr:hypothetical protein [Candidatus Daviesbacteria bacterium]